MIINLNLLLFHSTSNQSINQSIMPFVRSNVETTATNVNDTPAEPRGHQSHGVPRNTTTSNTTNNNGVGQTRFILSSNENSESELLSNRLLTRILGAVRLIF